MITRRGVFHSAAAAFLGALLPGVARANVAERDSADIRFEIEKDSRGRFRWHLVAANNKVIATSGQGHVAKADCKAGIELVRREAAAAVLKDLT